jgi:2-C-methyl-D-erythritol 4-phosphate cytidylyltransferase
VPGRADNIKVTYPEDLVLAAAVLQAQAREAANK